VVELERIPKAKALHRFEQRRTGGDADHADVPMREFWRRHRHNHESIVYLNDGTGADGYTGPERHRSDGLHVVLVFVLQRLDSFEYRAVSDDRGGVLGIKYAITYRRGFTEVRIVATLGGSDIRPFHRQKRFANTSLVEHGHAR
jgi:hypothetical protein